MLRQEVLLGGRHRLVTDEPPSAGGEDSGPSPHELVPAALASCIGTTIAVYARTKGWDLGEVTVDVVYEARAQPRHIDIEISVSVELSPDQRTRIARAAATCQVHRLLAKSFEFSERVTDAAT
jgi:putative redox protein